MFNIGRVERLCQLLGVEVAFLMETLDDFDTDLDSLVHELTLWPADPTKMPRDVIAVRGDWRMLQHRLYRRILLSKLAPSRWSHGGVKGRSAATNARKHLGNTFAYVTDVSGFFPSISCKRVNQLFLDKACSYKVAGMLTRLCTHNYHLALGLITSPVLANELIKPLDFRIAHACRQMNLTYTRFVDDITISGKFDLKKSGIHGAVQNIVQRHGFNLAEDKTDWGRLDGDLTITGIRLKKHRIDASKKYVAELERLIADHASLADGGEFSGPLLTEGELFGKSFYVCGLNRGRRRSILGKLKSLDWKSILKHASERRLVRHRKRLQGRGMERPDCTEALPEQAVAIGSDKFIGAVELNSTDAPF